MEHSGKDESARLVGNEMQQAKANTAKISLFLGILITHPFNFSNEDGINVMVHHCILSV